MYLYLEPQDISCIESFCFRLCYGICYWNNLQTAVEIEVDPLCKVCFPWFSVISEQTHTKALNDWGVGRPRRVGVAVLCKGYIGVKAGHDYPRHTRVTSTVHAGKAAHTNDITCPAFSAC